MDVSEINVFVENAHKSIDRQWRIMITDYDADEYELGAFFERVEDYMGDLRKALKKGQINIPKSNTRHGSGK